MADPPSGTDPLLLQVPAKRSQRSLEAHLRGSFGETQKARDLGEGGTSEELHDDHLPLTWCKAAERSGDRSTEVGPELGSGEILEHVVERNATRGVLPATGFVGEAPLRDSMEPGEHRNRTPVAVAEGRSCVLEDFLHKILGTVGVTRLAAEVAEDLRMVSPEGQLSEAFHLLPLSLADAESNGL